MEWHDFYLTVGGVSGALVGLLFVAMSLRAHELGGTSLLGASKQALLALVIALVVSLLMLAPPRAAPLAAIVLVLGGMAMVPGSVAGQLAIARRRLTLAFVLEAGGFDLSCVGLLTGGAMKLADLWLGTADVVIACAVIVLILLAISRSWRLATGKPPSVVFAASTETGSRTRPSMKSQP
ncbi:MAG TPA: hypothetical protein VET26_11330 [Candidatus Sulfotelmatobacter sp.]|nr:hypothetical protein [Candidatus Sulfotelmatobacter sp.]